MSTWRDETIEEIGKLQTKIDALAREERRIKDMLGRLRGQRDRLRQRLSEPPTGKGSGYRNGRDPLVISRTELGQVLEDWGSRFGENCWVTLSERSGVHVRTIRRLRGMGDPKRLSDYTTLTLAEELLIAMGEEDALRDGRIKIRKNPVFGKAKPNEPPESVYWEE